MPEALPYARPLFVEEQRLIRARSDWVTAALLAVPVLAVLIPLVLAATTHAFPVAAVPWAIGGVATALIITSLSFSKTITVVEAGEIRLSIRVGPVRIWRRAIPLAAVRACELVEPGQPMTARPGWRMPNFKGIALLKFVGGDTLVMVRGGRPAVVLATAKFGGTLIGSARPAELAEVIQSALSPPSPLPPFPQT